MPPEDAVAVVLDGPAARPGAAPAPASDSRFAGRPERCLGFRFAGRPGRCLRTPIVGVHPDLVRGTPPGRRRVAGPRAPVFFPGRGRGARLVRCAPGIARRSQGRAPTPPRAGPAAQPHAMAAVARDGDDPMAAAPDAQVPHPGRLPQPAHAVLSRLRDRRHLLRASGQAPDRRQRARPCERGLGAPVGRHRPHHRRLPIRRRARHVARHGGGSDAARGGGERRAERVPVRVRDGRIPRSRFGASRPRRSRRSPLRVAPQRPLDITLDGRAAPQRPRRALSRSPHRAWACPRVRGVHLVACPGHRVHGVRRSRSPARRVSEPGSGGCSVQDASSRKPASPCASTTVRPARTRWRGRAIRCESDRSTSSPGPTSGIRRPSPRSSSSFAPTNSPPSRRARAMRCLAGAGC